MSSCTIIGSICLRRYCKRSFETISRHFSDVLTAILSLSAENVVERTFGDHAQNGWKPHVYNAAIRNVREKCNVEITKDNIASRCKTFDKHYEVISKILSQSGFGWDRVNDKLLIDSDDVWNKYANKSAACYKNKVVKNWDAISTIYSKDQANGQGAQTGAESAQVLPEQAILSILGDMKTSFNDSLKSTEPLPMPSVTSPAKILVTLQMVPNLARSNMLKSYGKFILNERLFQALLELPMDMRKEWLLLLN
ncbi:hypothetical protein PVAP13_6KG192918 [Panicum virgatum]|uniref:Myb/SANT-like domain-containing protein n=1 Tax=Panicum virgatum TaxID=38727 RepID=A0A8T0RF89_PANVG|nr:hypothetical protein PVAP13_6KG192918 [Panicum virgatum]